MKKVFLSALVIVLATLGFATTDAVAQSSTEWAAPFLGTWGGQLETPDGTLPIQFVVREADGDIEVVLDPTAPITDVYEDEGALVAEYEMDYQGMMINAVIEMSREGEDLDTEWSFADGMYVTNSKVTRQ